jgi:hypothetical protein
MARLGGDHEAMILAHTVAEKLGTLRVCVCVLCVRICMLVCVRKRDCVLFYTISKCLFAVRANTMKLATKFASGHTMLNFVVDDCTSDLQEPDDNAKT